MSSVVGSLCLTDVSTLAKFFDALDRIAAARSSAVASALMSSTVGNLIFTTGSTFVSPFDASCNTAFALSWKVASAAMSSAVGSLCFTTVPTFDSPFEASCKISLALSSAENSALISSAVGSLCLTNGSTLVSPFDASCNCAAVGDGISGAGPLPPFLPPVGSNGPLPPFPFPGGARLLVAWASGSIVETTLTRAVYDFRRTPPSSCSSLHCNGSWETTDSLATLVRDTACGGGKPKSPAKLARAALVCGTVGLCSPPSSESVRSFETVAVLLT
mmetsp:Transcript_72496/g.143730  ORF Transcript_72496/g.143730 Transcript_72496/m.143730 type:complete len:274 (+) Transcript_72496:127-948(+)